MLSFSLSRSPSQREFTFSVERTLLGTWYIGRRSSRPRTMATPLSSCPLITASASRSRSTRGLILLSSSLCGSLCVIKTKSRKPVVVSNFGCCACAPNPHTSSQALTGSCHYLRSVCSSTIGVTARCKHQSPKYAQHSTVALTQLSRTLPFSASSSNKRSPVLEDITRLAEPVP